VSKVFKNTAILTIWLAGLVILAHLVIPHDHHSDCYVFNKENTFHLNDIEHPVKTPIIPFHCHSLNVLTVEKMSTVIVAGNFPTCDLLLIRFLNPYIKDNGSVSIPIDDSYNRLIETDLFRLSPLRAPPSVV
jgi:hypothetical protein